MFPANKEAIAAAFPKTEYLRCIVSKIVNNLKKIKQQSDAINTVQGAQSSAIIYSITETARSNKLNVYYYIRHLLTELPNLLDKKGNIDQSQLEPFMPWSKDLPVDYYSKRRD